MPPAVWLSWKDRMRGFLEDIDLGSRNLEHDGFSLSLSLSLSLSPYLSIYLSIYLSLSFPFLSFSSSFILSLFFSFHRIDEQNDRLFDVTHTIMRESNPCEIRNWRHISPCITGLQNISNFVMMKILWNFIGISIYWNQF